MRERGEKEKKSSHHNNKTNMGIFTDHLPLIRKICRGLVTVHFFLGFAMTAMGFGLIEAPEDLQQITQIGYKAIFGIDVDPLLGLKIIGPCKVIGITAMYGYFGPILDRLANICFFLPVYAAYVGHNELGANENVPIIIGSLYFLVLVLPRGSSSSTTEQIKKD